MDMSMKWNWGNEQKWYSFWYMKVQTNMEERVYYTLKDIR